MNYEMYEEDMNQLEEGITTGQIDIEEIQNHSDGKSIEEELIELELERNETMTNL